MNMPATRADSVIFFRVADRKAGLFHVVQIPKKYEEFPCRRKETTPRLRKKV